MEVFGCHYKQGNYFYWISQALEAGTTVVALKKRSKSSQWGAKEAGNIILLLFDESPNPGAAQLEETVSLGGLRRLASRGELIALGQQPQDEYHNTILKNELLLVVLSNEVKVNAPSAEGL